MKDFMKEEDKCQKVGQMGRGDEGWREGMTVEINEKTKR